ncbi:aldo/keto reductase [Acetobacterium woodii]|uniref:Aldo/keto reductase n=1 Tax=Acetobacterium woodii (strain ATCC 29683 / DSM 1030 / JCM 2381 / KCTC 1655 / WB1) TaxID=931626 RepID=H6LK45_ACEWD|nr:aldo/keto reductase [Acetobacterium woodii]AFA49965.1 aldo/keto reductase [Acetobacterium woodii DSM 1030]
MLYRKFGKTNEDVSVLGFGCMRLPVIDGDQANIDDEKAIKMVRYAIDHGVNYIDTAYPYHGAAPGKGGESEPFVARALKDGYREKVKLATKLPVWMVQSYDDMERLLDEQLKRLETDVIDFYLLHGLNKTFWHNMEKLGVGKFLDQAIKDGKIKYAGFSFHDDFDLFVEIVDAYDWDFCQIQYNYLDENYQAGKKGLEYAASKGMGVTIMEPIRGGGLVDKLPQEVLDVWDKAAIKRTPAQWALRWVMNHPEVSVVLSGMNTMDQVVENINTANEGAANSLTKEEIELVDAAKKIIKAKMKVNCTGCRYCMPCPSGVDIPGHFSLYNNAFLFDMLPRIKNQYVNMFPQVAKASNCVECGNCEEHCPQNIAIIQELKNVRAVLESE